MLDAKSVQIPFPTDSSLSLQFGANLSDPTKYRVVVVLNTSYVLVLTLHSLSISSHNSRTSLQLKTGTLSNVFFDFFVELLILVFSYIETLHSLYMHFQMLIGQETNVISPLLVLTLYIVGAILFHGVAR